jgi:hypothetical protein
MMANAIVNGRVKRFRLSPALARLHQQNGGSTMTDAQAVALVEAHRRRRALRAAKPYLEARA